MKSNTLKQKAKDNKTKIMVIDDHPLVRQGLAQIINQEDDMTLVAEAGDANEALLNYEKAEPDLIIVDISLKGTSGVDLTKTLLSKNPKILILVISMYDESLYAERVLRAGAKGYLMKQEATENVVSAIRRVLSGETYVSDKMKDSFVNKLLTGNSSSPSNSAESLSDRELEVLQLVGQGYATREVASTLHVSVKTVESHYANIKMKLDLKNSNELIQYAVKWSLSEK